MPTPLTLEAVRAALAQFYDPESGRNVIETRQVRDLQLADGRLSLTLELTTHSAPLWDETRDALGRYLRQEFPQLQQVEVELAVHHRPAMKLGQVGVTAKSVVAVGSGKGGVGKSTVAACLALGLRRAGCRVGLMDADVYGPSVPHLLGVQQRPEVHNNRIEPIDAGGLKVMSMGFLVPRGEAVVWRGPMLHGAITQFLRDTNWGELDYLVIDLPPGTGDIALTLSQLLPLTGAVVVCTPQDVALLDAEKAIAMFEKVNIPVLGIVENMSYFECPGCGQRYDIFGSGGARRCAAQRNIPFLGEVPINIAIRVHGDAGQTDRNFDEAAVAPYFQDICHRLAQVIAETKRGAAGPQLPQLTVL
jgi:ATP-binding protein involved in chromosome partitioning